MRKSSFLGVDELRALAEASGASRLVEHISCLILRFLQGAWGVPAGLSVPEYLTTRPQELWRPLLTLEKLKQAGIIDQWSSLPSPEPYPDEPPLIRYTHRIRGESGRQQYSGGYDFFSEEKALWASIGETVERHALQHKGAEERGYIDASWGALGGEALDLSRIAGISPETRESFKGNFSLKFDKDTVFRWVRGHSLTQDRDIWVPEQLISFAGGLQNEPVIRPLTSNGAAAHQTLEKAILAGALELIERDAFMIHWLTGSAPDVIDKESVKSEKLQEIFSRFERYHLDLRLLYLKTDFPVHIVCAVILDESGIGPAVIVGASAEFNIDDAIEGATKEALSSRKSVRRNVEERKKDGTWEDYRNAPPEKVGREERLILWAMPEMREEINPFISGTVRELEPLMASIASVTEVGTKESLVSFAQQNQIELAYVETTGANLKRISGLISVTVVSQELHPLHLWEGLPCDSGPRVSRAERSTRVSVAHPFP